MFPSDKLSSVGEHSFVFSGLAGQLEGLLTVPPNANKQFIALLGHPHSLQGGTMNNKVVSTMSRAFKELEIASLRFNFRGVGQSEGLYDDGIGESEDMLILMRLCQQELAADAKFIFAGFSFGSYVAYRAAAQAAHELLITVAPPVHHYNYEEYPPPRPWVIMQGDEDEVVPFATVKDFADLFSPPLAFYSFAETSHFFHGKLLDLKTSLLKAVKTQVLKR
ncbi:MAG: hypothetical protein H0U73_05830 [Tatlockia sp.]|nr:hypothetical protein [Tatlockia sp.]